MSVHQNFLRTGQGRLSALVLLATALSVTMPASADAYGARATGQLEGHSLATQVSAAIDQNAYLSMMPIYVEAWPNGRVQLTGYVDNPQDVFTPERIAMGVPGVRNVQNDLVSLHTESRG